MQATIKAARNARDLIVLAVAGAICRLWRPRRACGCDGAQVVAFAAIYKQAADRLEAGLATRRGRAARQGSAADAAAAAAVLAGDLETQKLKLARMIGLPAGQRYVATEAYRFTPLAGFTEDEALERAEADRPDLQAAASASRPRSWQ